jgi:Concanavalin A-like lectin/glucanases superfamily
MRNATTCSITCGLFLAALAGCGDNHTKGTADAARADARSGDGPVADAAPDAADNPDAAVDAQVSDLVLHYAFEDQATTVADSSGRGLDGVLSDATAWTAAGRDGRGLALDGANPATQYVSMPDGVLTGVKAFTIATWVNVAQNQDWSRIYDFGNGLPDPAGRFMFMTVSGYTGAGAVGLHTSSYGGSAADENLLSAGATLPTGVWKHVAITGFGGMRQLYVDGFPVATVTGGPSVPPQEMEPLSPNSWIGKSRFASDPGFDGTLDDFRIYDRQLTAAEIQDLAWPKTDYSYWRFDEGSGTTTVDSSDNAIGSALAGGATWTTGRLGGAVDLAGGSPGPYVALTTSPLAGCTDQVTIAAWVKLRTLSAWSRVFDFGIGTTRFIYLAPTDGTGMHFAMVAPSGVFDLVTPTEPIPADDAWHHVAVTVDANNVTLYADGVMVAQQASPAVTPADFSGTTDNWLGRSEFADPGLDGAIDELRVSCRAYTADEIAMLARQ